MVARDLIDGLHKRLEDERAELVSQLDALQIDNDEQQADSGVGNHLADDASELFLRERNIALRGNTEELLAQIDSALKRMDAGSYGVCERCGQPIAAERLEALPYAAYCITCQAIVEQER
jgi:DnaK suppressor protein